MSTYIHVCMDGWMYLCMYFLYGEPSCALSIFSIKDINNVAVLYVTYMTNELLPYNHHLMQPMVCAKATLSEDNFHDLGVFIINSGLTFYERSSLDSTLEEKK